MLKKIFFLTLSAFIFFQTKPPVQAAKPVLLFILDGQSNAAPHASGESNLANPWKQTVVDTLINAQKVRKANENDHSPNPFFDSWIPANPYTMKDLQFDIDGTGFGPELTFIKTLKPHYPNHIIALAQRALGGTSIVGWDKNHSTPTWQQAMNQAHTADQLPKPPQYPQLMLLKQQAVATLNQRADVSSVTMAGFLWVQNEQDAGKPYGAEHYEENLRKLVRNVRSDWNVPNMPFMFVDTHTKDGSVNAQKIDDAVAAVKNSEPKTAVINTKDLGTHEGTHYNTSGTIQLGIRFAQAYLEITSGQIPPTPPPISHTPAPTPTRTPTLQASPTSTFQAWDLNQDTIISILDYSIFIKRVTNGALAWNSLASFKQALAL